MRLDPAKEAFRLKARRKKELQSRRDQIARSRREKEDEISRRLKIKTPDPMVGIAALRDAIKKAPKLAQDPCFSKYLRFIERMPEYIEAEPRFVRPPADWVPRGKGTSTLFRSLCSHLFALYPMPEFLWSAFMLGAGEDNPIDVILADFARFVGRGGSPFEAVKLGLMPAPLTRQMCHAFMTTTGDVGIMEAIRRAQILSLGGDRRLAVAWMKTHAAVVTDNPTDEAFWQGVIAWFCKIPMLDSDQVSPMVDYIRHRHVADARFSMKGRSAISLIKSMTEWHADLAKARFVRGKTFEPSGFKPAEYDRTTMDKDGKKHRSIWRVAEILSDKALHSEGVAMKHCVYSYACSIAKGNISIWSMTEENDQGNWRRLTIEVNKQAKRVCQARAVCNQRPSARDMFVLGLWAKQNDLILPSTGL